MSSVRAATKKTDAHFRYLVRCLLVGGYCCSRRPCAYDRHAARLIAARRRNRTLRIDLGRPW